MLKFSKIILSGVIFLLCCLITLSYAASPTTYRTWGSETQSQIYSDLGIGGSWLYRESIGSGTAFHWPQGVQFYALCAAAKLNASYLDDAENLANEMHSTYWYYGNGYWGYNAVQYGTNDRYYDDNAWVARALLNLYEITDNLAYRDRAEEVIIFVMSGENPSNVTPYGGIKFHEGHTGAAVCATAPAAWCNLKLYQQTGRQQYLTNGLRLYNWLKTSGVQDVNSGLYHQGVDQYGAVNWGYRGYQASVPAEAALLLYQITGDSTYLSEAQWIGNSMSSTFAPNGILNETGQWGGHDMTDAFVSLWEVDNNSNWLNIADEYLEYLHDYCKDGSGRYPESWNDTSGGSTSLLHQAPASFAYWRMASTGNAGPVMMFEHPNYNGWAAGFEEGAYDYWDMIYAGAPNDDASAVMVAPGYKVTLYWDISFGGSSLTLYSNNSDLAGQGWDNQVTSLIIEKDRPELGVWHKVVARHSGKCLDVNGISTATGANIMQHSYNGGNNQQWMVTQTDTGYYKLTARHSGKAADVADGGTADGVNVRQWDDNESYAQQWDIVPTGDGYYAIFNRNSGKSLTVDGYSFDNGANINQWVYIGALHQQWSFETP